MIDHVSIGVRDLAAMLAFVRDPECNRIEVATFVEPGRGGN